MSSSLDLSWRARLALALALVITAAGLPRLAVVRQLAGGTAVPLAAGVSALVALLAARLPLGFAWGPAGSQRAVPEVARGFAVGAACAAALIWQGNDVLLARKTEAYRHRSSRDEDEASLEHIVSNHHGL